MFLHPMCYIITRRPKMRILFAIVLLELAGCAGNKPVAEKSVDKCEILFEKVIPEIIEQQKNVNLNALVYDNGKIKEECPCSEVIICNNENYCIAYKCSSNEKQTYIWD
jgi:hypothetical protein